MSEIVKITTHEEDAISRLPEQYKGKPKFERLVRAYGTQAQALEDVLYEMILANNIFYATGAELDQIGDIVIQPRDGRLDDAYRVRILAKIAQNVSTGTGEELIRIFKLLMQARLVYLNPIYPASMQINAVGFDPVGSAAEIKAAMNASRVGGTSFDFFAVAPDEDSFSFLADPDPKGKGFGTTADPLVGGYLASIY